MTRLRSCALLLAGCAAVLAVPRSELVSTPTSAATLPSRAPLDRAGLLASTPAAFVPNQGQWEGPFRYRARLGGMTLFLQERGWTVALVGAEKDAGAAVRMRFEGRGGPCLVPEGRMPGRHSYFPGADRARWRTDVPLYASVVYRGICRGVDVRAYEKDRHLEYDLMLEPGVDLAGVEVAVEGAAPLRVDGEGSLVIETAVGTLRQPAPSTWQTGPEGERRPLVCRYVLRRDDRFGFEVEGQDEDLALTIDPGLLWSTYLGGGSLIDAPYDVAVDPAGIVTVVGQTLSPQFPTTAGAFQPAAANGGAFVMQLDPSRVGAAQLLYSTYLGQKDAAATVVSVDVSGVITLSGGAEANTAGFPTTPGAYSASIHGWVDAFVVRLDPSKTGPSQLVYSTLLGGSDGDGITGHDVDSNGVVTVAGNTSSRDFPTTPGAFAPSAPGGDFDGFVSQLDPGRTGSGQLIYSTYVNIGPNTLGFVHGMAMADGVVTLAGETAGGLPVTPGAFGATFRGPYSEGFVAQLDLRKTGSLQLVYSSYLGGTDADIVYGVAIEKLGRITLVGTTWSADFPTTPGSFAPSFNGGRKDAFVSQIDPSRVGAAQLTYSTFLGSAWDEEARAVTVDAAGVLTVVGRAGIGFPTTPGAYESTGGGAGDGFITRLDPDRTGSGGLVYSTLLVAGPYFGAPGDTEVRCVHDEAGVATIAGWTNSPQFPTTPGAFRPTGGVFRLQQVFAARLDMLPTGVSRYGSSSPGCEGPLAIGVTSWPQAGNAAFSLTCNNAPPGSTTGWALLTAAPLTVPATLLGVDFWVSLAPPLVALPAASNAVGAADVPLPIPSSPGLVGQSVFAQFLWAGPAAPPPCPRFGLSTSNALQITFVL